MEYIAMETKLKNLLSEERFLHSKGVEEFAAALAKRWGADEKKARVSGLLHDSAKNLDRNTSYKTLKKLDGIDHLILQSPSLWHGPVGAALLKQNFEIDDPEIYDAVFYHTIGKPDMSLLTKIVFIADAIEVNRDKEFDWSKDCRNIAMENLEEALVIVCDKTILSLIQRKLLINPNCILIRNQALSQL